MKVSQNWSFKLYTLNYLKKTDRIFFMRIVCLVDTDQKIAPSSVHFVSQSIDLFTNNAKYIDALVFFHPAKLSGLEPRLHTKYDSS